jgi:hypothetical protein
VQSGSLRLDGLDAHVQVGVEDYLRHHPAAAT